MKIRNTAFGYVAAPIIKPLYVLQMARSKSWSPDAQLKALINFKTGLIKALDRTEYTIVRLKHRKEDSPS